MSFKSPKSIEECFEVFSEQEFVRHERSVAYSVIGPPGPAAPLIFATKPTCVLAAMKEYSEFNAIGLIGRYGLPNIEDVAWIRDMVRKRELMFLGDMDPLDLLIFAWLRVNLHPSRIVHLGVSDSYLEHLRVELPQSFIMPCAPSESASFSLLETVLPDLSDVVGPQCAALLENGRKIELEAVVSALGLPAPLLMPALPRLE